ncbi:MAG TPA: hypothetical protein VGN75_03890, partial [Kaistia sp.]|nr:hypothetical protein [Kaistia sp.]
MQSATASWLSACPYDAAPAAAPFRAVILDLDGRRTALSVSPDPPAGGCARVPLGLPAEAVRWAGFLPAGAGDGTRGYSLIVDLVAGRETVSEVTALGGPSAPVFLPLGTDLLAGARLSPFGAEERAAVEDRPGGKRLSCAPGDLPAGMVVEPNGVLPPLPLAVELHGSSDEGFMLGVADARLRTREALVPLGLLGPLGRGGHARFPARPVGLEPDGALSWTLLCPPGTAALDLQEVALRPDRPVPPPPGRAAWAWDAGRWRGGGMGLLEDARRHGVDRLYVSVPIHDGAVAGSDALVRFVREARSRDIEVWAVEGDPHAVLPEGRRVFLERARALAAHIRAAPPEARLAGVQYDIEPYLVPGYPLAPDRWNMALVRTLSALRAALNVPVDAALPFWLAPGGPDTPVLEALPAAIDSVTVMAYRTDPASIQMAAGGFLDWGRRHGKPVSVAVEAGPLPDQRALSFVPAPAGTLWRLDLGGEPVLLLLDRPAANPH